MQLNIEKNYGMASWVFVKKTLSNWQRFFSIPRSVLLLLIIYHSNNKFLLLIYECQGPKFLKITSLLFRLLLSVCVYAVYCLHLRDNFICVCVSAIVYSSVFFFRFVVILICRYFCFYLFFLIHFQKCLFLLRFFF